MTRERIAAEPCGPLFGRVRSLRNGHNVLRAVGHEPAGAFYIAPLTSEGNRVLRFICPCGCRSIYFMRVVGPADPLNSHVPGPSWSWDGNLDAPSVSPSFFADRGCGWHGHLVNGTWVSV